MIGTRSSAPLAVVAVLVAALHSGVAHAQDVRDLPGPVNPPLPPLGVGVNLELPYWAQGRIRPFVAAVFDVGGVFARSEVDVGYGRPHYLWAGVEASSQLSLGGVTMYVGPRATIQDLDLRVGIREFNSLSQHLLAPRTSYQESDLDHDTPPREHYDSLDASVGVDVPALHGSIGLLASINAIFGVPNGLYVFEDALRVVVDPPIVWQTRLSYLAFLGRDNRLALGGTFQLIGNPNRDLLVFRSGPVVAVELTDHLQAIGAASFAILSRDNLGIAGDDIGQIALRYRWASGEAWPDFP